MGSRFSEPSPRWGHCSAVIGAKIYVYGGRTRDFHRGRTDLASEVHVFNQCMEMWKTRALTGKHPPCGYRGACASSGHHVYLYGGWDGSCYHNFLYQLDTETLECSQLPSGPSRKSGCGMVSYDMDKLVLFGGYGLIPATQPEAEFAEDSMYYGDRRGWTNELHIFHLQEEVWSSPVITGTRPPPCSRFSFTMVDDHHAVLFGGNYGIDESSNRAYMLDLEKMHWSELDKKEGEPWPVGRSRHAAVCLGYGEHHSQLLVTGGLDKEYRVLSDTWILDVQTGRWRELAAQQPKCSHSAAAINVSPELAEVTLFGGYSEWPQNFRSDGNISPVADTTVLQFEYQESLSNAAIGKEWVLMDVIGCCQLGSKERMEEKATKLIEILPTLHTTSKPPPAHGMSSHQEVEGRLEEAERRCRETRRRLEEAMKEQIQAKHRATEVERRLEEAIEECEKRVRAANARTVKLESTLASIKDRAREVERMATTRLHEIERNSRINEQLLVERAMQAERRLRDVAEDCDRRVQESEYRASTAEGRATELERQLAIEEECLRDYEEKLQQLESQWVVERREIQLTGPELGRGGWATVSVAKFRGARVAAKCLHHQIISRYNISLFEREMNMAARIRHPNLLQFIGATQRGELIILTELMPTSLRRELESRQDHDLMSPQQVTSIGVDVARALNYLHLMQPHPLIHRDISSANVLLQPLPNACWRAKVSDYGTVNLLQELQTVNPGNPTYAAPEANDPTQQSPRMDIFSFGVLLLEMLTGEFPDTDKRSCHLHKLFGHPLLSVVQRCLQQTRQNRPSANDIISLLNS